MKNLVSKLIGGIALTALVIGSVTTTVNAQPVDMNDVNINTAESFEAFAAAEKEEWTFISRDFVYKGSKETAAPADK
ncbi:hypothetical protein [uncultured Tenacibaculum sp.]|uniref:hypothetical protein n=1 Tax=uncultured Tenacibaculum sp. TaxID=174713 RepID=UPI0026177FA9|nr:hypothetical protein [uncultured Tenacibaculum sp.]